MKGILFRPESIQAIIEGRKTQTRRVNKLANKIAMSYERTWVHFSKRDNWWELKGRSEYSDLIEAFVLKPRYQVGETVYIKEAFEYVSLAEKDPWKDKAIADGSFRRKPDGLPVAMCYKLDGYEIGTDWLNPLFMPEWAARYFIVITDVRAERLQEIGQTDISQEGLTLQRMKPNENWEHHIHVNRVNFMRLWNSINKDYPWESNPWVFRYKFEFTNEFSGHE